MTKAIIDPDHGHALATPESFRLEKDGALWGWFAPQAGDQYYSWLYWGEASPKALAAVQEAGVPVYDAEGEQVLPPVLKCTLVHRMGDTTPNAWHFASSYDALLAHSEGTVRYWNYAVLKPGRKGQASEELPAREWLEWVTGE